jgi:hypothetical protein
VNLLCGKPAHSVNLINFCYFLKQARLSWKRSGDKDEVGAHTCLKWGSAALLRFVIGRFRVRSFRTSTNDNSTMVKPLHFKGDKKLKKRKRVPELDDAAVEAKYSKSDATTTGNASASADDDDSWVTADVTSDISGPVLIVLPTDPASFLACDANGSVFTSNLENFVDDDPATAEPHDVRQVWIATRVAGTESFSLKGHHGRSAIFPMVYS